MKVKKKDLKKLVMDFMDKYDLMQCIGEELIRDIIKLSKTYNNLYVKKGSTITHIRCELSGVLLPATEKFFDKDKSSPCGFKTICRQAGIIKEMTQTKNAVMNREVDADLKNGLISFAEAKEKFIKIYENKPDYSAIKSSKGGI